ncbi:hypothetical protein [Paenibacillus alkalitolerans]|uniref:hypothetical protein n=1 Tax=Paenibacillus alkalitolerans TaxID=2799335 RepID=UPI0018F5190B|nr:hypothetical protein [Paenibacillus alkalitolerans]
MSDENNKKGRTAQVWAGFGLVALLHLSWLALHGIGMLIFGGSEIIMAYIVIGISQLVYVVPLCVWFALKNRAMLQGALLAALATFLLNAACFGIVMYQFASGF